MNRKIIVGFWALFYLLFAGGYGVRGQQPKKMHKESLLSLIESVENYEYEKFEHTNLTPDTLHVTVLRLSAPASEDAFIHFSRLYGSKHPYLMYDDNVTVSQPKVYNISNLCTKIYAGKSKWIVFEDTVKHDLHYYADNTKVLIMTPGYLENFPMMDITGIDSDVVLVPLTAPGK